MQLSGGRWLWLAAVGAGFAALSGGCGDGSAESQGPTATLHVTRDFGRERLSADERAELGERTTMLQLLREDHDVDTSARGGQIEAIDGQRRNEALYPRETIWAANVNGIESDQWPHRYRLYEGDVVQLDLRHWYVTLDVRATVGAFPETFSRGVFGRRFPTTVRCERPASTACRHVKRLLHAAGVRTDGSRPPGKRPGRLRVQRAQVLVGTWEHWRHGEWPHRIDMGPRFSGVFARFSPGAGELGLFDWNNHPVRSVGPGSGLVGAMRPTEEDLLWVVTGVDDVGVERAAKALGSPDLRDAFSAAVTAEGVEKLPLPPRLPVDDERAVTRVVTRMYRAFAAGDAAGVCATMSKVALWEISRVVPGGSSKAPRYRTCEDSIRRLLRAAAGSGLIERTRQALVTEVKVKGDQAVATVSFGQASGRLELIREGAVWRLGGNPVKPPKRPNGPISY